MVYYIARTLLTLSLTLVKPKAQDLLSPSVGEFIIIYLNT